MTGRVTLNKLIWLVCGRYIKGGQYVVDICGRCVVGMGSVCGQ